MPPQSKRKSERVRGEWFIPGAILIGGLIIAFAVYTIHHRATLLQSGNPTSVRPVDATDHVLGNPAAPVVVIEYADIDSEYSKVFQKVMEQLMQIYGPQGNIAWVYRHFPLIGEDANAEEHAEAAECVASQGGTSVFFKFIDTLQSAASGTNQFDPANYDAVVSSLGLSTTDFDTCLNARTYQKRVGLDYQNALDIGATGAPYSVLLVKGQTPIIISGGLPYNAMKQVIDQSIAKVLNQ
ncbi:thioredoxin domain-containing protein [Patescibacteria group bacterium]|nr:thioredoxin domain-containing protein [Patescibacteria group bacterium]